MQRFPLHTLALLLGLQLGSVAPALAQAAPPTPAPTREQRVAELVKQLGDAAFDKREAAQRELETIGAPAIPALTEATKSSDPEVATRATEALTRIRGGAAPPQRGVPQPAPPEERRGPQGERPPAPMPNPNELLEQMQRELEGQLPEELKPFFRLFGRRDPNEQPGQGGFGPNVREFRFSFPGNGERQETSIDGTLGWELGLAPGVVRTQLGITGNEGVVVNRLDANGWAAKHGVQLHDVIVGCDGRSVRSVQDLQRVGQGSELELYRRAQPIKVKVPAVGQAAPPAPRGPAPNGPPPNPPRPETQPRSGERSF